MADAVVYFYGICQGADPACVGEVTGVTGAPVRLIPHGDLAALVSTVREEEFGEAALRRNLEDLDWVEGLVRSHHAVTGRAAAAAPTAPARAATIFRGDDRVKAILVRRQRDLRALIGQIAGTAEWGVKVIADPEPVAADPRARGLRPLPKDNGGGRPGTAYLLRRKAEQASRGEARQHLVTQAARVNASLARHATAVRHHPPQDQRLSGQGVMLLNSAYLVAHQDEARFTATARELAEGLPGARLSVTGPWPAYSFASLPDLRREA